MRRFAPWLAVASLLGCGARTDLAVDDERRDAAPGDAPSGDAPSSDAAPPPPLPPCVEHGDGPEIVSVTPDGSPSVGGAGSPTLSRDGRYVAFVSSAGDLMEGDTNDELDVFVRDRTARATVRASVATDGTQGDDASGFRLISGRPSLSGDGSLVVFPSNSDQLHPDDDNGRTDVYVHALRTGETRFVRFPDDRFVGGDAPVLSEDGRFVAFAMLEIDWDRDDDIAAFQVVRVRLEDGAADHVSVDAEGRLGDETDDGLSSGVDLTERVLTISADGRFVGFASGSRNLDTSADTHPDVFVRDMARGALAEASEAADEGSFGPSLSADGRIVAFTTRATTYPDPDTFVYVHDRDTGAVEPVPEAAGYPVLSDDGRFVAFVWERRVYAYDRRTGERAALAPEPLGADDTQHEPYLSGDGCWATYLFSQGPVTQVWVARNPLR